MWLPPDERHILAGLYHLLKGPNNEETYELHRLAPLLKTYAACDIDPYGFEQNEDNDPPNFDAARILGEVNAVRHTIDVLATRGLIKDTNHDALSNVVTVALTVHGYDLGRKYALRWFRTGLWYAEHKDHWISLIVSVLAAIITSLIVCMLTQP